MRPPRFVTEKQILRFAKDDSKKSKGELRLVERLHPKSQKRDMGHPISCEHGAPGTIRDGEAGPLLGEG